MPDSMAVKTADQGLKPGEWSMMPKWPATTAVIAALHGAAVTTWVACVAHADWGSGGAFAVPRDLLLRCGIGGGRQVRRAVVELVQAGMVADARTDRGIIRGRIVVTAPEGRTQVSAPDKDVRQGGHPCPAARTPVSAKVRTKEREQKNQMVLARVEEGRVVGRFPKVDESDLVEDGRLFSLFLKLASSGFVAKSEDGLMAIVAVAERAMARATKSRVGFFVKLVKERRFEYAGADDERRAAKRIRRMQQAAWAVGS